MYTNYFPLITLQIASNLLYFLHDAIWTHADADNQLKNQKKKRFLGKNQVSIVTGVAPICTIFSKYF